MERLVDELATAQLDDYKKLYLKDREIKISSSWTITCLPGRCARLTSGEKSMP